MLTHLITLIYWKDNTTISNAFGSHNYTYLNSGTFGEAVGTLSRVRIAAVGNVTEAYGSVIQNTLNSLESTVPLMVGGCHFRRGNVTLLYSCAFNNPFIACIEDFLEIFVVINIFRQECSCAYYS